MSVSADQTILAALRSHYGHQSFRPGQQETVKSLLEGRSALAVFPTGGGKSICYQLPALLLPGLTLVISPLIALMKDQVDALQQRGIAAARLDSSLSAAETQALYTDLQQNRLKLLYVAPERLANARFRQRLAHLKVDLLAIDEAHCISEWGHNFRPDYLKLAGFAHDLEITRVLCLTATATPEVSADIRDHFQIKKKDHHQLTFYRPNLNLAVTPLAGDARLRHLQERLTSAPAQSTIIYCTLQHGAESVASYLTRNGITARPYHAGLRPELRSEIQEQFMAGEILVICATIAFGMGIDKSDIRAIYHFNLPKSLENYTQEIGRAGRDGKAATCELIASSDDLRTLSNFTYGDTPQPDSLRSLLRHLLSQPGTFDISKYELSRAHDIRPLVLNTLLTYLELEGYLQATTPFYSTYKVKFARSLPHLLKGHPEAHQKFLRRLFASGTQNRVWLEINLEEAAVALLVEKATVQQALAELEDHGDIISQPTGLRQGYHFLKEIECFSELADRLIALFQRREDSDLTRLQQVVDYALSPHCLYQGLLLHFGEEMKPCGHCSRCLGEASPSALPGLISPEVRSEDLEVVRNLISLKQPGLRNPRSLARFLCGLTSPATAYAWYLPEGARRKKRLSQHDAFALFEDHHFADVLILCQSQVID